MTAIEELAELRQQVQSLLDANAELHGDYLAAVKERDELRAIVENIQEGCTPADARMLREANHGLIDENAQLRAAIVRACEYWDGAGDEASLWDAVTEIMLILNDALGAFGEENQIEGGDNG